MLEGAHGLEASRNLAEPPVSVSSAAAASTLQSQPNPDQSTLRLLQANVLVAMLAGFWARKADGHPGPDLMSRGLVLLNALVQWERTKTQCARNSAPAKARGKPG